MIQTTYNRKWRYTWQWQDNQETSGSFQSLLSHTVDFLLCIWPLGTSDHTLLPCSPTCYSHPYSGLIINVNVSPSCFLFHSLHSRFLWSQFKNGLSWPLLMRSVRISLHCGMKEVHEVNAKCDHDSVKHGFMVTVAFLIISPVASFYSQVWWVTELKVVTFTSADLNPVGSDCLEIIFCHRSSLSDSDIHSKLTACLYPDC